jgi:hypothetical protein
MSDKENKNTKSDEEETKGNYQNCIVRQIENNVMH